MASHHKEDILLELVHDPFQAFRPPARIRAPVASAWRAGCSLAARALGQPPAKAIFPHSGTPPLRSSGRAEGEGLARLAHPPSVPCMRTPRRRGHPVNATAPGRSPWTILAETPSVHDTRRDADVPGGDLPIGAVDRYLLDHLVPDPAIQVRRVFPAGPAANRRSTRGSRAGAHDLSAWPRLSGARHRRSGRCASHRD